MYFSKPVDKKSFKTFPFALLILGILCGIHKIEMIQLNQIDIKLVEFS